MSKIFPIMRDMQSACDQLNARYRQLAPRYGEIAVGGEHMGPFFKAVALERFLSDLRKGCATLIDLRCSDDVGLLAALINAAAGNAKLAALPAINKWNVSIEYQVHRWTGCCDDIVETWQRRLLQSVAE